MVIKPMNGEMAQMPEEITTLLRATVEPATPAATKATSPESVLIRSRIRASDAIRKVTGKVIVRTHLLAEIALAIGAKKRATSRETARTSRY